MCSFQPSALPGANVIITFTSLSIFGKRVANVKIRAVRETIVCANQLQNSRSVLYKIVNTNEVYSDTSVIRHLCNPTL